MTASRPNEKSGLARNLSAHRSRPDAYHAAFEFGFCPTTDVPAIKLFERVVSARRIPLEARKRGENSLGIIGPVRLAIQWDEAFAVVTRAFPGLSRLP